VLSGVLVLILPDRKISSNKRFGLDRELIESAASEVFPNRITAQLSEPSSSEELSPCPEHGKLEWPCAHSLPP
tara:strand:+ start:298 stop:516 length:219 start_codon:yes stop_codon:yes gene_type:complete